MFSIDDLQLMKMRGITPAQVASQIEIFSKDSFYVPLHRPCTLGDGVRRVNSRDAAEFSRLHHKAAQKARFSKFVPASGAATRMFQSLLQIYYLPQFLFPGELQRRAQRGVAVASEFLRFLEALPNFPFLHDLRDCMAADGLSLDGVLDQGHYRVMLDYLLTDKGMNYGCMPKALLKFHDYGEVRRTALEEQLVEAIHYAGSTTGKCNLHLTVSPEHETGFRDLLSSAGKIYREQYGAEFDICLSHQKASTDTVAVDLQNQPFRDRFGQIHFRPGGHGALIENLNDTQGDLVYIKNIDNVVPETLIPVVVEWKRILGGISLQVESGVHSFMRSLRAGEAVLEQAEEYAGKSLNLVFPHDYASWPSPRRREFLLKLLNRPIRVCGVVENAGEPGGAPFWVEHPDGTCSIQIVEKAQVDFTSPEQQRIWASSTHFNPVDLVCSLRDCDGRQFDLKQHVDPGAVFISVKSKEGRELKALELPGLWNGSMSDWISIIVEVPRITFNPVKTVFDLLRPEHQALNPTFAHEAQFEPVRR